MQRPANKTIKGMLEMTASLIWCGKISVRGILCLSFCKSTSRHSLRSLPGPHLQEIFLTRFLEEEEIITH